MSRAEAPLGKNAKSQNRYMVVAELSIAREAWKETTKLASHPSPMPTQRRAARRRRASKASRSRIVQHPTIAKAELKENQGAMATKVASHAKVWVGGVRPRADTAISVVATPMHESSE